MRLDAERPGCTGSWKKCALKNHSAGFDVLLGADEPGLARGDPVEHPEHRLGQARGAPQKRAGAA